MNVKVSKLLRIRITEEKAWLEDFIDFEKERALTKIKQMNELGWLVPFSWIDTNKNNLKLLLSESRNNFLLTKIDCVNVKPVVQTNAW